MQIMDSVKFGSYTNSFGGYKVEEELHLGVREHERLNTIGL
jgi:hypothetical protein